MQGQKWLIRLFYFQQQLIWMVSIAFSDGFLASFAFSRALSVSVPCGGRWSPQKLLQYCSSSHVHLHQGWMVCCVSSAEESAGGDAAPLVERPGHASDRQAGPGPRQGWASCCWIVPHSWRHSTLSTLQPISKTRIESSTSGILGTHPQPPRWLNPGLRGDPPEDHLRRIPDRRRPDPQLSHITSRFAVIQRSRIIFPGCKLEYFIPWDPRCVMDVFTLHYTVAYQMTSYYTGCNPCVFVIIIHFSPHMWRSNPPSLPAHWCLITVRKRYFWIFFSNLPECTAQHFKGLITKIVWFKDFLWQHHPLTGPTVCCGCRLHSDSWLGNCSLHLHS